MARGDTQVVTVDASPGRVDFSTVWVPEPDPDAVVDPHWLELRGDGLLPALYMPPTMRNRHPAWMRAIAAALMSIFLLATALGICLTYGPPTGW